MSGAAVIESKQLEGRGAVQADQSIRWNGVTFILQNRGLLPLISVPLALLWYGRTNRKGLSTQWLYLKVQWKVYNCIAKGFRIFQNFGNCATHTGVKIDLGDGINRLLTWVVQRLHVCNCI